MSILKYYFFNTLYKNWSPDASLRYLPIVSLIKKDRNINSILDVGSGTLGITPYLKVPITGLDTNFNGPKSPFLKQIKGSAYNIPYDKNSYDSVICVDVLEHISPEKRSEVIKELLRVAKKKVFIVCPCDKDSEKEDQVINSYVKKTLGLNDSYLSEHIKLGLPTTNIVKESINSEYKLQIKNLTNIYLHRLLLKMQFTNSRTKKFISSVVFVLLVPLFLRINIKPTYRKLFIITKRAVI